jgi:multicomponent Na+:H+ antiporter subunit F
MNLIHMICALVLLFAVVAGMIRIIAGPTAADRMMAAQLFGTCGVAILLLLAKGLENAVLLDIALVFALLAALASTTFVRRAWYKAESGE